VLTRGSGHAVELARQRAIDFTFSRGEQGGSAGVVVAAGGDGTANEVINGLMQAKGFLETKGDLTGFPVFGVLPMGRGNDFAYGAGVPHDLHEACRILAAEENYSMDVGLVLGGYYPEGRFFGNGIGIGFDTLVGLEAAKMSWIPGFLGYVYGALKVLLVYPKGPQVRINWKNGEDGSLETVSQQISIMNGRRMGGTFFMAPESIINDGFFDLCMTRGHLPRSSLLKAIGQYTRGTQKDNPNVVTGRASEFRITAPGGGLVCHADGETISINSDELSVRCIPGALRIRSSPREG